MIIDYNSVNIKELADNTYIPMYEGKSLYDAETKKPMYEGQSVLFKNVPKTADGWFKRYSVENQKNNQDADKTKQMNDAFNKLLDDEKQTNNQTNKPEKSTADKTKELKDNVAKLEADLVKIEADEKAELKAVRDRFRKKKNNKKSDIEKAKNVFREYVFANNPAIKEQVDKLLNG